MDQQTRVARFGSPPPQDAWISGGGRWDHVELSPSLACKNAFPEMVQFERKLARRDKSERQAKRDAQPAAT